MSYSTSHRWCDQGPDWPGWITGVSKGGSPTRRLRRWEDEPRRLAISWGPVGQHFVGGFGPGARWFIDLEAFCPEWPSDLGTGTCVHIERGFRTLEQALAMRDWLRSCVEVAGDAGLLAWSTRTGGRPA